MDSYLPANRALWDERVPLHRDSAFYDLAGFKAGRCSLKSIELAELGPVTGKSLLHLQCHFGMDTLSWARLRRPASPARTSRTKPSPSRSP